jgi:hypothetical protein
VLLFFVPQYTTNLFLPAVNEQMNNSSKRGNAEKLSKVPKNFLTKSKKFVNYKAVPLNVFEYLQQFNKSPALDKFYVAGLGCESISNPMGWLNLSILINKPIVSDSFGPP